MRTALCLGIVSRAWPSDRALNLMDYRGSGGMKTRREGQTREVRFTRRVRRTGWVVSLCLRGKRRGGPFTRFLPVSRRTRKRRTGHGLQRVPSAGRSRWGHGFSAADRTACRQNRRAARGTMTLRQRPNRVPFSASCPGHARSPPIRFRLEIIIPRTSARRPLEGSGHTGTRTLS